MRIIHNYHPIYTKKLVELGMVQKGDGFKITQNFATPEYLKFNEIAQENGELFELVKEFGGCFYIDRYQGGTFWSDYEYDYGLIEQYDKMTEDGFLGLQVHELGATRVFDWMRIERCMNAEPLERNAENIYEAVKKISHNKIYPHFSQGTAEEYASLQQPKTYTEFFRDIDFVIEDRQKKTGGRVLLCDAGKMCCGFEKENDINVSFIEVGAQTSKARMQFAARRGISRARGKKWGVYLETWNDYPTTSYTYMKNGLNDFYLNRDNFLFFCTDENGGSSMSLARRTMFYALFSGANYYVEEMGMTNTFYDWESFELTPFGKHKRDMFALSRELKNVKPKIPVAIVIPKKYKVLMMHHGYPLINDVTEEDYVALFDRINGLFCDGSKLGHEDYVYTTGRYGSLFDIIYEDSYGNPACEYEVVVDYSGKFLKQSNVVDGYAEEELKNKLDSFFEAYLPFTLNANGGLDYSLFENDSKRYCCIYNHNGITKTQEEGEMVNPEASVTLRMTLKDGNIKKIYNVCGCDYTVREKVLNAELTGGTFILIEY